MKKSIKIGTIPRIVNVDGRIKLIVGKKLKVKEEYKIQITEINNRNIKARCV